MADLSRNGTQKFGPSSSSGSGSSPGDYGIRRRTALALDLGSPPSDRRNWIAQSLSGLAFNAAAAAAASSPTGVPVVLPNDEKEKTAAVAAQTPTPTQFLFPKNVTEEQEAYASGFELALKEIYKEKGPPAAIAASTGVGHGLVCGDANPFGIDVVCSTVSSSTVSVQANSVHSLRMPSRKDAAPPTLHLDPATASGSNSCGSFLQSLCSSNQQTPRSETALRQESRCTTMVQNVALDERNAAALRSGSLGLCQLESRVPNVAQSSSRDVGGAELLHSRVQLSAGKSPEGSDVRGWIPSAASIPPQIHHSHVTAIPLNHQNLAGPVRPCRDAVSSVASFGSAVPVSDRARFGIPTLPGAGAVPPVYEPPGGFHGCGSSQRMLFSSPGSASLPASGMHPTMGLEPLPVNQDLWIGPSSAVKPEPHHGSWMSATGGAAAPVGVVNMDDQERLKLERKRAKNRVAAQRCQMRKLERIARLEDKAEKLREQNAKLLQTVDDLRSHVSQLKKQITAHANKGCRLMFPDVTTAFNPAVSSL